MELKGLCKDLTGKRFGRLEVIKQLGTDEKTRQKLWLCKCDCGKEKITKTSYLTSGDTSSCGCYRKESEQKNLRKRWANSKRLSKTRLYSIWADMKQRCLNTKNKAYKHYGQRGIKICKQWLDFMNFYNWAVNNGYNENLSIDRINNDGNYEPNNCRWATNKEQANNKRNTRKIIIFGETKTAYEFEKQYNISAHKLLDRYKKGYKDDKIIYSDNLSHFTSKAYKKMNRDKYGRFVKIDKNFEGAEKCEWREEK